MGSILKGIGSEALKMVRRSNSAGRLRYGSQLLVLQPDHWLFPAFCQYKRHRRDRDIGKLQRKGKTSLDEVKTKLLKKLLGAGNGLCSDVVGMQAVALDIVSILYL